jgi:septal ring-binding cell division protein DamX
MRILRRSVILIMLFLMLQACASTRIAEQLQSGKISFEGGNFKSAFHKLLPLASEGNAQAQYAVGYMYYYGYGTAQDEESGIFWMKKAAGQHDQTAIEALKIIKRNKISEEPTQQLTAERSIKEDSDKILQALADNQSTQPSSLKKDNDEGLQALTDNQSIQPSSFKKDNDEVLQTLTDNQSTQLSSFKKDNDEGLQTLTDNQSTQPSSLKKDNDEVLQTLTDNQSTQPSLFKKDNDGVLEALTDNRFTKKTPLSTNKANLSTPEQTSPRANPKRLDLKNTKPSEQFIATKKTSDFTKEHKKRYTLQLMGSYHLADIKQTQDRLKINKKSYCAHTKRQGRDWYILAYGEYSAPYLAKLAMDDLPRNIREMKPWVRALA